MTGQMMERIADLTAAKLTPAQIRALKGKQGFDGWLLHASNVRTDVRTALIRKGLWEQFMPEPHGLQCLRPTPLGRAVIAAINAKDTTP